MRYLIAVLLSAGFFVNSFAQSDDSLQVTEENLVCFQTAPDLIQCFVAPQQTPEDQMPNESQPAPDNGEEELDNEDFQYGEPGFDEPEEMEIFKREPYFEEEEEEYDEDWT